MRTVIGPWAGLVFLLVLHGLARGQTKPFNCAASTGVPPTVRPDGLAELTSDLVLKCTGGTPTPAGQAFPQFAFTLLLNANVTSRITSLNQFSEALLIVDEPASQNNPARPMLNCGNGGAPDNGSPGPGVCSIISSGNPALSYDGTPNGFGGATCDGVNGRPTANAYGCGRPNVFQGRIGTPGTPGQLNAVTFFDIPVDPPGDNAIRTLRITNVRVNAASVGFSKVLYYLNPVLETVTASGPIPISISAPQQIAAYLPVVPVSNSASCAASAPSRIRVCEGYGNAWKAKNISFAVGNGVVPGNASHSAGESYWSYNGGTNYPPDVAQNVPGVIYSTESAFEWQNNAGNGPPSPNPPFGLGTVDVQAGEVAPFNSSGFGGLNTGIVNAGIVDSGTRIAIRFTGIPQGASVQIPPLIYIFPTNAPTNGTYQNGSTGVMLLTNTDSAGAGVFNPGNGTLAGNLAVYEILWADPFSIEYAEIPYTLVNAPDGTTLQVTAGFAPFYSDSGSQQSGGSYPIPRFLDSNEECGGQSCLNATPNQGLNSGPVQVTFTYYGNQTLTGAQVLLRAAGSADIPGQNLSNPSANALTATFSLSNAPVGAWDVIITPSSGQTITLAGGFSVVQTSSCAYSVGPQSIHAPAGGASGGLVLSASSPQCPWMANPSADWITLQAISTNLPFVVPYSIAANSSPTPRTGTIIFAGESIPVTQDAGSCSYEITPRSQAFGANGGMSGIEVLALGGVGPCTWSVTSTLGWVSFPNGTSGSGNDTVVLQVGANTAGFRSGTVTIAGQSFAVSQDASPCGGTDVSRQVNVSLQAFLGPVNLLAPLNYGSMYTQQLRLTNKGAAIPGPVSMIFYGLCPSLAQLCGFASPPGGVACQANQYVYYPTVSVAPNGLAAGQTIFYNLQFNIPPYTMAPDFSSGQWPNSVSYSVISGTPGQ